MCRDYAKRQYEKYFKKNAYGEQGFGWWVALGCILPEVRRWGRETTTGSSDKVSVWISMNTKTLAGSLQWGPFKATYFLPSLCAQALWLSYGCLLKAVPGVEGKCTHRSSAPTGTRVLKGEWRGAMWVQIHDLTIALADSSHHPCEFGESSGIPQYLSSPQSSQSPERVSPRT